MWPSRVSSDDEAFVVREGCAHSFEEGHVHEIHERQFFPFGARAEGHSAGNGYEKQRIRVNCRIPRHRGRGLGGIASWCALHRLTTGGATNLHESSNAVPVQMRASTAHSFHYMLLPA